MYEIDRARRELRRFTINLSAGVGLGISAGLGVGLVISSGGFTHPDKIEQVKPSVDIPRETYDPIKDSCPSQEVFLPDTNVVLQHGQPIKIGESMVQASLGILIEKSERGEERIDVNSVVVKVDQNTSQAREYNIQLGRYVDLGFGNHIDVVGNGPRAYTTVITPKCSEQKAPTTPRDRSLSLPRYL